MSSNGNNPGSIPVHMSPEEYQKYQEFLAFQEHLKNQKQSGSPQPRQHHPQQPSGYQTPPINYNPMPGVQQFGYSPSASPNPNRPSYCAAAPPPYGAPPSYAALPTQTSYIQPHQPHAMPSVPSSQHFMQSHPSSYNPPYLQYQNQYGHNQPSYYQPMPQQPIQVPYTQYAPPMRTPTVFRPAVAYSNSNQPKQSQILEPTVPHHSDAFPSKPLPPPPGDSSISPPAAPPLAASPPTTSSPAPLRPNKLQRQKEFYRSPERPNPPIQALDSTGNRVIFLTISKRAKPAKKDIRRVRPSGLVETIRKISPELRSDIVQFQMENYAKHYFQHQRRGIFRRDISVDSLLQWSKELNRCLLNNLSDTHAKIAAEIFKAIQVYMGDRPPPSSRKKNSVGTAQFIATHGVNSAPLRDEIYCQIIKQITLNPSEDSTIKGWELMAISIESFPCTKNLEPYIRSFLDESAQLSSKPAVYAAFCLRRYDACWKGNSAVMRTPTEEEILHIQESEPNPFLGAIFGGSIKEIMAQQKEAFPNVRIPRPIAIICDCILESGGESAEGIFRISSNVDKMYQMKVLLEKGNGTLPVSSDPHIPACLLKTWFMELQDPIIPTELYDSFLRVGDSISELSELIVNKLPVHNRNILYFLIRFLRIIGDPKNMAATRMGLHNLALIFSPNLFRCPSNDPMTLLANTKKESACLDLIFKDLKLPESIPGVYGARGGRSAVFPA